VQELVDRFRNVVASHVWMYEGEIKLQPGEIVADIGVSTCCDLPTKLTRKSVACIADRMIASADEAMLQAKREDKAVERPCDKRREGGVKYVEGYIENARFLMKKPGEAVNIASSKIA